MRLARTAIFLTGLAAAGLGAGGARAESSPEGTGRAPGSAPSAPVAAPAPPPAPPPALAPALAPTPAETGWRLIMVEQPGCAYCARWNAEIGPIYPKTPEGALAPLERVGLRDTGWRQGLTLGPAPVFTPTFLLIEGKTEVGRIEGYPGEAFFWGLLGQALQAAGAPLGPDPG